MPWDWLGSRLPILRKLRSDASQVALTSTTTAHVVSSSVPKTTAPTAASAPRRASSRPPPRANLATVIPREAHPISRKAISPNALRVLYRLREAGFDGYLVGGAVRDLLVGIGPKDFDIATNARPEQVRHLFRNCRLIGRRFRLAHVIFGPEIIEVATFRAGGDDGSGDRSVVDGRIVRDNVYGSIEDDAERRDFTANALYYSIEDFSVHDFVGGFGDVERRILRLIGDPEARYREDPVRMLRAVRLATKLGFTIEEQSAEPISRLASLLADASPARLFDESLKLLLGGHARESVRMLERFGLLDAVLPATAIALREPGRDPHRQLVDAALAQTDQRLREERSVSPAFLFAALLWPAVVPRFEAAIAQGHETQVAWGIAADEVLIEQVRRVALPRRFSTPMIEIWQLQSRFEHLQRKRVVRLLAHPRFRAAYDFLALRGEFEPEAAALHAFWHDVEGKPESVDLALRRVKGGPGGEAASEAAPRKRRRRGGRGRGKDATATPPTNIPA